MVFIVLNAWFLFENDPHWIIALIISLVVFAFTFPSSKICKLIINKGDKITSKLFKTLYYIFALPVIFILLLLIVLFLLTFIFEDMKLSLGTGVLIAFTGIGIFTCVFFKH